tara:strand:- start:868 stop:1062 length:195 start_codon:yes stop_codon:yes gene_type:complete
MKELINLAIPIGFAALGVVLLLVLIRFLQEDVFGVEKRAEEERAIEAELDGDTEPEAQFIARNS